MMQEDSERYFNSTSKPEEALDGSRLLLGRKFIGNLRSVRHNKEVGSTVNLWEHVDAYRLK